MSHSHAKPTYRKKIHDVLEVHHHPTIQSKIINSFISTIIVVNMISMSFETVESIKQQYALLLNWIDVFTVIVFTFEYILRIWSCVEQRKYHRAIVGRLKYATTPMAIIDLLAIIPFFLESILFEELRFLRILRLLKLFRYSAKSRLILHVIQQKKDEIVVSTIMVMIMIMLSAGMIYYAEHQAQPDKFSSIPESMWWSIITLTSVGYGDVTPITPVGKFFGSLVALLGLGAVALPTGIVVTGFIEIFQQRKDRQHICPHCGKDIHVKPHDFHI